MRPNPTSDTSPAKFTLLLSRPGIFAMTAVILGVIRDVPGEEAAEARRLLEVLRDAVVAEARAIGDLHADDSVRHAAAAVLPSIFDVRPIDEESA
jgi:hypothetical protein